MNHIDDSTLNEYLDHALDESKRDAAKTHLQACANCREKLDELQSVVTELDTISEVYLENDLVPSILARLPQKTPVRIWTRAFAAQMGVALGFVFWLGMQAVPFIRVSSVTLSNLPAMEMQALFTRLLAIQIPMPEFRFPTFSFQLPTFGFQMPTLMLEITTVQLITLSVSVVLLWLVGNVILLRSRQRVRS